MAVTFSTYFCQSVQNHPRVAVVYLVAVTALIATLATLNWGEGVNVIVGSAVAGGNVVALAIAYVHFRRQPLPAAQAAAVEKQPPESTESLESIITRALNRNALTREIPFDRSYEHFSIDQVVPLNRRHAIVRCRYEGGDAYLLPVIDKIGGKKRFFLVTQDSNQLGFRAGTVVNTPPISCEFYTCIDASLTNENTYRWLCLVIDRDAEVRDHLDIDTRS